MNKKYLFILLGLIILLNLVARVPFTPHEMGADSFYIHSMINTLQEKGEAPWVLHPASLIGLYPYSYPSFDQYLVGDWSFLFGLNIENTILVLNFALAIMGILFSYLLIKEVTKNEFISLLGSLFFSFSPIFLKFTQWTNSTRHLATVLTPLFLYFLIKQRKDKRYLWLAVLTAIIGLMSHKIFILVLAFSLSSYFAVNVFFFLKDKKVLNGKKLTYLILIYIPLMLMLILSNIGFFLDMQYKYSTGLFANINPANRAMLSAKPVILFNMAVDYASSFGIISFLALAGFLFLLYKLYKNNIDFNRLFMMMIPISSMVIMTKGLYNRMVILPVIMCLASIGTFYIINLFTNAKTRKYIVLGIVFLSIIFSIFMINHWVSKSFSTTEKGWLQESTHNTINYLNTQPERVISTELNRKIGSELDQTPFPISGKDTRIINYGVNLNIGDIRPFTSTNQDYLWTRGENPIHKDWADLLRLRNKEEIMNKYNLGLIIYNKGYLDKNKRYPLFNQSLKNNKIYDNNKEQINEIN